METISSVLIVFFASLVDAGFGFGGGILAIPLLSLSVSLHEAVFIYLVFQMLKGVLLFWGWKHIAFKHTFFLIPFLTLGVFLGYKVLVSVDPSIIQIFLALYLISYVLLHNAPKSLMPRFLPDKVLQSSCGLVGGTIQGAIGNGGPVLVTYLKSLNLGKESFRFTVIFLLLYANTIRTISASAENMFTPDILRIVMYCLPAYGLATYLGNRIPKRITDKQFNIIISFILIFSAISLLYKSLLS